MLWFSPCICVLAVRMRKQVVNPIVHPQIREAERRVIVILLQGADPRGVGTESQRYDSHINRIS